MNVLVDPYVGRCILHSLQWDSNVIGALSCAGNDHPIFKPKDDFAQSTIKPLNTHPAPSSRPPPRHHHHHPPHPPPHPS